MSTAIEFENISKQYRLGLVSTNTLSHDLKRWWVTNIQGKEDPYLKIGDVNDRATKGSSDYVWALKDINFKVDQGDVLGIIGKNGAGKSTLLKILSKVTAPSTGIIRAKGRIASLLEVGTGFHPEMTGRENIYMNGAIMGMTKAEITRKLDEIVDFSGVERYIDTPAKRYSSGMTVRLGFAIAAHLDPEILVVDEVLAVGDAEFQKKAIGKMQDVARGEGRTVLFVSHNMPAVQTLCTKGIVLENGLVSYNGSVQDAVHYYLDSSYVYSDNMKVQIKILNKSFKIDDLLVNGRSDNNNILFEQGENKVKITLKGSAYIPFNVSWEVMMFDETECLVGMYTPTQREGRVNNIQIGSFEISEEIIFPETLTNGEYFLSMKLSQLNIEYLADINNFLKINISKNASSVTGVSYDKSYFGYLILK
jgi:lipopolysaccharide transport system ATP-binding protein